MRNFPAFGLNTEKYSVSLRIQSECGKIWSRKTPNTNIFHAVQVLIEAEKNVMFLRIYCLTELK